MNSISIRKLTVADIPLFYKWWNDIEVNQFTQFIEGQTFKVLSNAAIKKMVEERLSRPLRQDFLIIQNAKPIGHIAIWKVPRRAHFNLYIAVHKKSLWGKGIGSASIPLALKWFFKTYPKESAIDLEVMLTNTRAIACYNKCGFKKIRIKKYKKYPNDLLMRYSK